MTNEEKVKDELVELAPSRKEMQGYSQLSGSRGQLVLVACTFEGRDRYAIARLEKKGKDMTVEPLALMLNEKDIIHLRQSNGQLLPTAESELLIN